jgi:hypothetical protein
MKALHPIALAIPLFALATVLPNQRAAPPRWTSALVSQRAETGRVRVLVTDLQTERPLEDVRVEIRGADPIHTPCNGTTNDRGTFELDELAPGRYTATVISGSTWQCQPFHLREGELEELTFAIPFLK